MEFRKLFLDFKSFYKKAPRKIQLYYIFYSLISCILYFALCFLPFFLGKIIDNVELGIKDKNNIIGYIVISITTIVIFRLFNNINIKIFNKTNKYILKKYILNQIKKEDNNSNKYINFFDEATDIFSDFIITLPSYVIIIISLITISIIINYYVGLLSLGSFILLAIILLLNDKIPLKKYSLFQKEKEKYYSNTSKLIENKLSLYSIEENIIANKINEEENNYYKAKKQVF